MNTICGNDNDDSLMVRAAGGDTAAFDLIVRRHQHRLQRFATRMLGGDSAGGADVAVGAFVRLWERRRTYQVGGDLGAWLIKTAYRLCLDSLGKDRRHEPIDEGEDLPDRVTDSPHVRLERTALAQAVRDAVMALPETHRAVLVLSAYEGLSYETISIILDVPAGTVASRKNHALTLLRRRLAAWGDR